MTHARPQSSRGTPFTRICAAVAGFVVTRSNPYVVGSGPVAPEFETKLPVIVVVVPAVTVALMSAGGV